MDLHAVKAAVCRRTRAQKAVNQRIKPFTIRQVKFPLPIATQRRQNITPTVNWPVAQTLHTICEYIPALVTEPSRLWADRGKLLPYAMYMLSIITATIYSLGAGRGRIFYHELKLVTYFIDRIYIVVTTNSCNRTLSPGSWQREAVT